MPTAAAAWRANTAVSKATWWPWPFDLESGDRVTRDVGYLCADFSLPRPLCSWLMPHVRDGHVRRQTKASLNKTCEEPWFWQPRGQLPIPRCGPDSLSLDWRWLHAFAIRLWFDRLRPFDHLRYYRRPTTPTVCGLQWGVNKQAVRFVVGLPSG